MKNAKLVTDKIQTYLGELSPKAVRSLVARLEKSQAAGSDDPNLGVILGASLDMVRSGKPVEETFRDTQSTTIRKNQVQRMFFKPLDDFLIDEMLAEKQPGRIHRSMLNKIWLWLKRDVLTEEISAVIERAEDPDCTDDELALEIDSLQDKAIVAFRVALESSDEAELNRRRLSAEMGGARGLAELKEVYRVFQMEADLIDLFEPYTDTLYPNRFKVDTDLLQRCHAFLKKHKSSVDILAGALLSRTSHPAMLPGFGMRLAGVNNLADLANSEFTPLMTIAISEVERLALLAHDHRKFNPDPIGFSVALSDYHEVLRGLEVELDLSQHRAWRDLLTAIKRSVSNLVAKELESVPGLLRGAIAVPKIDQDGNLLIDYDLTSNAIRSFRVFVMVRNAPDTFAVNDLTNKTRQAVEQMLEITTRRLINDLSGVIGNEQRAVLAAADNAIMLCELYYGGDYAAQLRRSRQSALGLPERKPVKDRPAGQTASLRKGPVRAGAKSGR